MEQECRPVTMSFWSSDLLNKLGSCSRTGGEEAVRKTGTFPGSGPCSDACCQTWQTGEKYNVRDVQRLFRSCVSICQHVVQVQGRGKYRQPSRHRRWRRYPDGDGHVSLAALPCP